MRQSLRKGGEKMQIKIEKSGLLTTIQDLGRKGHQKEGIIESGAMDKMAIRIGNLLLGNQENHPAIEAVQAGPEISFDGDQVIAITGAESNPMINGFPVKQWCPIFVKEGSVLESGRASNGTYFYICFLGNPEIEKVLGSYSTYLKAHIGGLEGRALKTNDHITLKCDRLSASGFIKRFINPNAIADEYLSKLYRKKIKKGFIQANWMVSSKSFYPLPVSDEIRILKGPEFGILENKSKKIFFEQEFKISNQSDRMGIRLIGQPLQLQVKEEMLSTAVTFGTVQLPPEGNPIILMADHQTTGGYPRIGQVISADFSKLAQIMPGKSIKFKEVSLEEALQALFKQEKEIEQLKAALRLKFNFR
jgi:antagonist of KipI